MRLRTIMTFFFCISAIAPLAIFWLWPQTRILEAEVNDVKERHMVIARNLEASLDHYYVDVIKTFEYFLQDNNGVSNLKARAELLDHKNIKHVCTINKKSSRIVKSINSSNYSCPNSIDSLQMAWVNRHLSEDNEQINGKIVVTGVVQSADLSNVFYILYQDKTNITVGTISTEYLVNIGRKVRFGKNGHAIILDNTGNVFFHPKTEWIDQRANLKNFSPVKKIKNGETGFDVFFSAGFQEEIITGFIQTKTAGWGIMVGQPVNEVLDKVSEVKHTALLVMGIGFLIALALAYFASKILTHPIEQMVNSMRRIGNGELWAHEKMTEGVIPAKEFTDARDSIKTMAEKLQENIDTISRHAYLDGVTGLPNRECFRVLAQEEIEKLSISGNSGALLFLDLDGFKQVNDVYGHRAGDDLLLAFSQRLQEHCSIFMQRNARGVNNALTVMPARLGGDEFVVFFANISGPEAACEFSDQLFSKVFGKFSLHNGVKLDISGSVGGAIYPTQATDFDELLRLSDIAMYEAKNTGKGRFCMHKDTDDCFDDILISEELEKA